MTAARSLSVSVRSVIGTPMRLFRLPVVASTSPKMPRAIAAVNSLVVVLPAAPPTAMTGSGCCLRVRSRCRAASSERDESVVNLEAGQLVARAAPFDDRG